MSRNVKKATIQTIVVVLAIVVVTAILFVNLAPKQMYILTRDLGFTSLSKNYAVKYYEKSDDIEYLAYSIEVSVKSNEHAFVTKYADELVNHKDFESYCQKRDKEVSGNNISPYKQYILGMIAVSEFSVGEKQKALDRVFSVNTDSFVENNAVVVLVVNVLNAKDKSFATEIRDNLVQMSFDNQYKQQIISFISAYIG